LETRQIRGGIRVTHDVIELSSARLGQSAKTASSELRGALSTVVMASGMTRCAISAVLEDEELKVNSPRIERLKRLGSTVLERVIAGDAEMTAFDEFSTNLLSLLRGLFQPANVCRSVSTKREKLWTSFHQICIRQLPEVWEQLFSSLAIEYDDDLLQQSTNQKLFEMLLSSEFSSHSQPQAEKGHGTITEVELSRDELNALRYACGYVPFRLIICTNI